jgi:hypothetical protein
MTEHKIKWSHSSLKDYEGCARRYHEVKVWCQSSLRLLSTTLGTLRKVHCATGAQYAHANFTQNIRSKSWHVITKKNTSAI